MNIRFSILAILTAALLPQKSFSWGKMGHAVVAAVAERHLTPEAKQQLDKYLHGADIHHIASDADKYRAYWTIDLGFHPTNPDAARLKWLKKFDFSTPTNISPVSHSVTVDKNYRSYRSDNDNGAYINNCAYYLEQYAKKLKKGAETMDAKERYKEIALIVHLIGDMHCPQHIVYIPQDPAKGSFMVNFRGKEINYHGFWDTRIVVTGSPADTLEYARMIDTATEKEIRHITKGNIYKWVQQGAEASWPAHKYQSGDTLPDDAIEQYKPLVYSQLRNAGYRLAAYLNNIFK